jgi:pilus assembly protein CpaE
VTATTSPIRTLLVLPEGVSRDAVEPAFASSSWITVTEVVEAASVGWRPPPSGLMDVLVIASGQEQEQALAIVADVASQRPNLPLVVCDLASPEPDGFMQRVFGAGADEIVTLPEPPERLAEVLRKAIARNRGAGLETTLAPLIAIVGPKGGTGKTVTACNLAVALAEANRRTVLVDLDLSFGDVGLGLRLTPERTVHDLARSGDSLDAEKLEGYLATHERSGTKALLAPVRPDQAAHVSAEFLARLFTLLRQTSDFVVVDTPAGFEPEVIAAIDSSTDVCVIGSLDAFSLKDTKLGLETLRLMGYDQSRIRLVLNRADSHVGISSDDVEAIFGRQPDVLVPSEREIARSITDGVPIVLTHKRSPAARAFRQLAAIYLGSHTPPHTQNGKSTGGLRLFGRN